MSRDRLSSTFDDAVTPLHGRSAYGRRPPTAQRTTRQATPRAVRLEDDEDDETRVLVKAGDADEATVLFLRDHRPSAPVERSAGLPHRHAAPPRPRATKPSGAPMQPSPAPVRAVGGLLLSRLLWSAVAASLISWLLLLSVVVYYLAR